jgi:hypothetical protein
VCRVVGIKAEPGLQKGLGDCLPQSPQFCVSGFTVGDNSQIDVFRHPPSEATSVDQCGTAPEHQMERSCADRDYRGKGLYHAEVFFHERRAWQSEMLLDFQQIL